MDTSDVSVGTTTADAYPKMTDAATIQTVDLPWANNRSDTRRAMMPDPQMVFTSAARQSQRK